MDYLSTGITSEQCWLTDVHQCNLRNLFLAAVHEAVAATMCQCRRLIIILSPGAPEENREDEILLDDPHQRFEEKIGLFDALTRNDLKVVLVEFGELIITLVLITCIFVCVCVDLTFQKSRTHRNTRLLIYAVLRSICIFFLQIFFFSILFCLKKCFKRVESKWCHAIKASLKLGLNVEKK